MRFHSMIVLRMLPYLAVSTLFVLTGCVSTSDLDAMRSDINHLKRDNTEIKREISEVKRGGTAREETFGAFKESQSSLYTQVSEQSKELQLLRGRFDEYKFFSEKAMKESTTERDLLRSQINSLEARVKELNEKIGRTGEAKPPIAPQKAGAEEAADKAIEQKKAEDTPEALYDAAYTAFKEKKYKESREQFAAFLKKFPKDGLAGNAHFWTGETYYAEKDHENAILTYETVIKNYPRSEKIPAALLKQGLSFSELGDKKTAKVIFDKLIEKYPDSKEAAQAKKMKTETDKAQKKPTKR